LEEVLVSNDRDRILLPGSANSGNAGKHRLALGYLIEKDFGECHMRVEAQSRVWQAWDYVLEAPQRDRLDDFEQGY
jgi:hypothetical protein